MTRDRTICIRRTYCKCRASKPRILRCGGRGFMPRLKIEYAKLITVAYIEHVGQDDRLPFWRTSSGCTDGQGTTRSDRGSGPWGSFVTFRCTPREHWTSDPDRPLPRGFAARRRGQTAHGNASARGRASVGRSAWRAGTGRMSAADHLRKLLKMLSLREDLILEQHPEVGFIADHPKDFRVDVDRGHLVLDRHL